MGRRRVPELDSEFDVYINNTAKILESGTPTGAVRLGLSVSEKNKWLAFRDDWNITYRKHSNPSQRTPIVTEMKNKLKNDFAGFSTKPLIKIAASDNLTTEDRAAFKLPQRKRTRTPRGSMSGDIPVCWLHSMGGGRIKVRVRLENAEGRPRKHPWADAVEMKFLFVDVSRNFLDPPVAVTDSADSHISKQALFVIDAGQKNLGKRMLAFFRWVNFTNPTHNSGWTLVQNVVVG